MLVGIMVVPAAGCDTVSATGHMVNDCDVAVLVVEWGSQPTEIRQVHVDGVLSGEAVETSYDPGETIPVHTISNRQRVHLFIVSADGRYALTDDVAQAGINGSAMSLRDNGWCPTLQASAD